MDIFQGEANIFGFTITDSATGARVDCSSAMPTFGCKASKQDSAFLFCFSADAFTYMKANSGYLTLVIPSSVTIPMLEGAHIGNLRLKFYGDGNVTVNSFAINVTKSIL
jgi:hypothetical protein